MEKNMNSIDIKSVKQNALVKRDTLQKVYFRTNVPEYCSSLYDYSKTKVAGENVKKFHAEMVEKLTKQGWLVYRKADDHGGCPELVKGMQRVYVHPQELSGCFTPEGISEIASVLKDATTCKHYHTDYYDHLPIVANDEDEYLLYAEVYDGIIEEIIRERYTTKRKNLYKAEGQMYWNLIELLDISTHRDRGVISTGSVCSKYVGDAIKRMKDQGKLVCSTGKDDMKLIRYATKAELKALRAA